uniref:Uncharacterized protein n=1 Tax=Clytia hemisphaerica TaxID=252671 RepID=A0A7M6DRR6_9CNID|eukprot:TCONS_00009531-protein
MIRATSSHVRWVDINNVQYRYQALQFHSEVMEVLLEESRERFSSMDSWSNGGDGSRKPSLNKRSSSVTSNGSFDSTTSRSRKTSVVQIKAKDDTSDYHSDDEVFDGDQNNNEINMEDFRTRVCYVGSCSIQKTSRISISDDREDTVEQIDELPGLKSGIKFFRDRSNSLKEQQVNEIELIKKRKELGRSKSLNSKQRLWELPRESTIHEVIHSPN